MLEFHEDIAAEHDHTHSLRILQERDLEENGPSPA